MDTNITMIRGDTLSFGVEMDGLDGQDLTEAFFTVRESLSGDDVVFEKSLGDGIEKVGEGQYVVRVAPDDTAELDRQKYYYDFCVGLNGDVFTLLIGVLTIETDVTRRVG